MNKRNRFAFCLLFSLIAVFLITTFPYPSSATAILNPKGAIAHHQRDLIITSTLLMLIIVIPVIIMTIAIAWRYREGNTKATYSPNWDFNAAIEIIWWALPCVIILILSALTWKSSHELDPYKPIDTAKKPLVIQVVALQWKWLFIYPEQKIATVNFLQIPEKTPIHFELTSDAPMNSFWVPQLGGQIYAMPGMKTELYLSADEEGSYQGSSASLSGEGFAAMTFTVKSSSQAEFNDWVHSIQQTPTLLGQQEYNELAKPSKETLHKAYLLKKEDLFDWTVMKYMMPMSESK